jgi:hypothetical protein
VVIAVLDFASLIPSIDIDPAETLIVRHVPIEKSMKRVLPWLVVERPDLWRAYQQIQWDSLEKAMTRARYIASFIGQEAGTATFAGLYRISASKSLDAAGYVAFPGNRELIALGMGGRSADMPDCLAFDLDPVDRFEEWIGRLTIQWPKPYQKWWRWASSGSFLVKTIEAESRFVRGMPDWQDIILTQAELQSLPASWKSALSQWRGIYFIYDAGRQAGYVGSASGSENILGRWRDYARNGHGGNKELQNSIAADLRFSILQRTSPDLGAEAVVALEASWKQRLHTREFGLNRN